MSVWWYPEPSVHKPSANRPFSLPVQMVELQNRLSEESKKADKMEFEYKRLKEKVDSLLKEKDVMRCCLTGSAWGHVTKHWG